MDDLRGLLRLAAILTAQLGLKALLAGSMVNLANAAIAGVVAP